MKITIVTVCFNAQDTIKDTVDSVLAQRYKDLEYLIMDGHSTDQTLEYLEPYRKNPYITIFSEPDDGLYNAMNKGIMKASGEYILFLNSGDYFADSNVLKDVSRHLTGDLVYGNVIRRYKDYERLEKYPGRRTPFLLMLQGRMMSHQVIFTRTEVMKKYGFDESFKITADYDFMVRTLHDRCRYAYVDRTISVVENEEGISSNEDNLKQMRAEDDRSLKTNFPVWYYLLYPVKLIKRNIK